MPSRARVTRDLSLAIALLCLSLSARADDPEPREVVSVGVFTMAPYVMSGPDGPSGALIDFFDHEIAPRMGVRFKWERPVTTARLVQSLASGTVQFTPILLRTTPRERAGIRFAGPSYIRFAPCLALLPTHPLDHIATPSDLAGITVGWVQGGALPAFMLDRRIKLDRIGNVDWTTANIEKLKLGRIGAAYFSNRDTPRYLAARSGVELKLLNLPTRALKLYGAFSPTAPASLAQRYERAAEEAFADGKFAAYLYKALQDDTPAP
jgi:ABC-type amino acid transport substrate-binding protein